MVRDRPLNGKSSGTHAFTLPLGGRGLIQTIADGCLRKIGAAAGYDLYEKVYLGRPWKDLARVIYQYSSLSDVINPKGWTTLDLSATPIFEEFENSGAGSDTSARVNETVAAAAVTMQQLWPDGVNWINSTY